MDERKGAHPVYEGIAAEGFGEEFGRVVACLTLLLSLDPR